YSPPGLLRALAWRPRAAGRYDDVMAKSRIAEFVDSFSSSLYGCRTRGTSSRPCFASAMNGRNEDSENEKGDEYRVAGTLPPECAIRRALASGVRGGSPLVFHCSPNSSWSLSIVAPRGTQRS